MEVLPIETERLILRQFSVDDAKDVFAILSDEQTTLDCGGYHAFDAMDDEYSSGLLLPGKVKFKSKNDQHCSVFSVRCWSFLSFIRSRSEG